MENEWKIVEYFYKLLNIWWKIVSPSSQGTNVHMTFCTREWNFKLLNYKNSVFYGHLVYFIANWCILISLGIIGRIWPKLIGCDLKQVPAPVLSLNCFYGHCQHKASWKVENTDRKNYRNTFCSQNTTDIGLRPIT
jgi:hypothetical protein